MWYRLQQKRSLMAWVDVIPKEGWALWPSRSFFWYDTDFLGFFSFFFSVTCHTKRGAGAASHAHPSFGMTRTQAIRDLLAWYHRKSEGFIIVKWSVISLSEGNLLSMWNGMWKTASIIIQSSIHSHQKFRDILFCWISTCILILYILNYLIIDCEAGR